MYSEPKHQRYARIIEVPIPTDTWDFLEDLVSVYGSAEKAILAAIIAHHKQQFGSSDTSHPKSPSTLISPDQQLNTHQQFMYNKKLTKIAENGRKAEQKTQKDLAKVDELIDKLKNIISNQSEQQKSLESERITKKEPIKEPIKEVHQEIDASNLEELMKKLNDLSVLADLKSEISSMKSMIKRLETADVTISGRKGKKADLSSLDINFTDSSDSFKFEPPDRPLLDSVLDDMLLFDEEEFLLQEKKEKKEKEKKEDEK